jgi:hypothetical protein
MRDLDDVPIDEIASVLSIPRFTAYSRLRKARRARGGHTTDVEGGGVPMKESSLSPEVGAPRAGARHSVRAGSGA